VGTPYVPHLSTTISVHYFVLPEKCEILYVSMLGNGKLSPLHFVPLKVSTGWQRGPALPLGKKQAADISFQL